jgi:hypothetical protein
VHIDVSRPDFATGELTVGEDASVIVQGVTLDCTTRACFYPNVVNHGSLTLRGVTVTDASAGAILQQPQDRVPARLTVLGSAIVHNTDVDGFGAFSGAGIADLPTASNPSFVTVVNSTIADNTADQDGGGIDTNGVGHVTLTNVTLTANHALHGTGGGLHDDLVPGSGGDPVRLDDTLIAGNTDGAGTAPDCAGGVVDGPGGHNLLAAVAGCFGLNPANGDLEGISDAHLGALAANGGATVTAALGAGSPAIGAGDVATCTSRLVAGKDQRGTNRRAAQRGACDIGAYDTAGR